MNVKLISIPILLSSFLSILSSMHTQIERTNFTKYEPLAYYKKNFNVIWNDVYKYYPSFNTKGVDWNVEYDKYYPLAIRSKNHTQFYQVIQSMINTLYDVHVNLIGIPRPAVYSSAIVTHYIDHKVVVTWAPESFHIPIGSIAISVNDEPVVQRLTNLGGYFSYNKYFGASIVLDSTSRKPELISLFNPINGTFISVKTPVFSKIPNALKPNRFQSLVANWSDAPGYLYGKALLPSKNSMRIAELPHNILYVFIPAMGLAGDDTVNSQGLYSEFRTVLQLSERASGLVLDIRGNEGGTMWPGLWFARHLYTQKQTPLMFRTRHRALLQYLSDGMQTIPVRQLEHTTQKGYSNWAELVLTPLAPHIHIPVALLTNHDNISAAENFISFMKASKSVKTFGTTTGGGDGNPLVYKINSQVDLTIPFWQDVSTASHLPIENFGLAPNVSIHLPLLEEISIIRRLYRKGNIEMIQDPTLASALHWLN